MFYDTKKMYHRTKNKGPRHKYSGRKYRIIPLQCWNNYRYIGQDKKKNKLTIKENHKFVFSKPKHSIDQN